MALVDNRAQRISMLCAMYVAQGLPWGFMLTAVISYLTDMDQPITDEQTTRLTAMIIYPWTFKLVWAPFIETMTIRSMGRRRSWIIGAELLMALSLLALIAMGDITQDITLLGWMFFMHNCFASLQDVSTDALAVDVLPPREMGLTNGLMWGSKLLGKGVGGAGMAWIISNFGFTAAVLVQFASLIVIMMFPLLLLERAGEKRLPWSRGGAVSAASEESSLRPIGEVVRDLRKGFSLPTTFLYLLFATTSVAGWGVVEVITKPLYTQDLGYSFQSYSYVVSFAVIGELIGALAGGWMADRVGRRVVMLIGFGSYGLAALVFAALPSLWDQDWFTAGYLIINPGLLAIGSVGFLSMGMQISWTRASATMFTIYMTLSNVAHVVGNELTGLLRPDEGEKFTYVETMTVAGVLMLVPLLLLPLMNANQVVQAKKLESLDDDTLLHGDIESALEDSDDAYRA